MSSLPFLPPTRLRLFWGLLMAGFILRVFAAVLFCDPEMWEFRVIATNLVSGHGYAINLFIRETHPTAFVPPAYSYLVAGAFALAGDATAARILLLGLNCLVGAISAVVIYLLGREVANVRAGWVAATLWLLFPTWIFSAARFHPVIIYTAGSALVTWLVLRLAWTEPGRQSRNLALATGLAAGVMCLFRGEYPLIFAALCTWALFAVRPIPLPRRLLACALALVMMAVVLLPWGIRNYVIFHRIIPVTSSGGYNLWRGHNPDATGTGRWAWDKGQGAGVPPPRALMQELRTAHPQADAGWELYLNDRMAQLARGFIREHPKQELILVGKKLFYFWGTDLTHPFARSPVYWVPNLLLMPFVLWGAAALLRDGNRRVWALLIQIGLATALAVAFFVLPRYRMAIDPFLFVLAGHGLDRAWSRFQPRLRPGTAGA